MTGMMAPLQSHRAEKRQQYQRYAENTTAVDAAEQLVGQPPKSADTLKPSYHSHEAKQQAKYSKINIAPIFLIRWNQKHSGNGTHGSDAQHRLFFQECFYLLQHRKCPQY